MHADRAARVQHAEHLEIERLRVGLGQARLHPAARARVADRLRSLAASRYSLPSLSSSGLQRPDTQRFGSLRGDRVDGRRTDRRLRWRSAARSSCRRTRALRATPPRRRRKPFGVASKRSSVGSKLRFANTRISTSYCGGSCGLGRRRLQAPARGRRPRRPALRRRATRRRFHAHEYNVCRLRVRPRPRPHPRRPGAAAASRAPRCASRGSRASRRT